MSAAPARPEPSRRTATGPGPSGGLQALPSRGLSALFGVAVLGVLLAGGLLATTLGGPPLLLGYVAVAGLLIGLGIAKLRALAASAAPPSRPACACCSGDHTAPVEVR